MPRYSDERKEAVLRKMLPPHNRPLAELAAEEGISEATLYNWRRDARDQGRLLPDGANLDRIQIIKGWLGADGKPQEHFFDVAVSDGRAVGVGGRCKPAEAARDTAERATGGK